GGDEVLPGVSASHTRMRARADDSFYRLENPRVTANGANPRGAFLLHFKIVERGKHAATHLMLRFPGNRFEVTSFGGSFFDREQGTVKVTRDPNGQAQFPEDIECFLARIDSSHGNPEGVFLVSDVVRIGDPGQPTRPRNWTPAEIVRFTKEAPAGLRENAYPGVGVETPFAGISQGGVPRRHVDPKGHLLGLEYRVGSWAGESCIGGLRPIYLADQGKLFPQSAMAKEGYAVSGAEVQFRNNVDAVKLHFRRIKPDGSLDPTDSYEGTWFGAPDPACRTILLGDTGPRVIGIFTRSGAVVDGLALVLAAK
ncbi:MAG TPA: hypothetical protein VHR72_14695, partial [Gemmataceae bacterium]|nr:hypothetical protein [Gemmataceae bacterium]